MQQENFTHRVSLKLDHDLVDTKLGKLPAVLNLTIRCNGQLATSSGRGALWREHDEYILELPDSMDGHDGWSVRSFEFQAGSPTAASLSLEPKPQQETDDTQHPPKRQKTAAHVPEETPGEAPEAAHPPPVTSASPKAAEARPKQPTDAAPQHPSDAMEVDTPSQADTISEPAACADKSQEEEVAQLLQQLHQHNPSAFNSNLKQPPAPPAAKKVPYHYSIPSKIAQEMLAGQPAPADITVDVITAGQKLLEAVTCKIQLNSRCYRLTGLTKHLPDTHKWHQVQQYLAPAAASSSRWQVHMAVPFHKQASSPSPSPAPAAAPAALPKPQQQRFRSASRLSYHYNVPVAAAQQMLSGRQPPCDITLDVLADGGDDGDDDVAAIVGQGLVCQLQCQCRAYRITGCVKQLPDGYKHWQVARWVEPHGDEASWKLYIAPPAAAAAAAAAATPRQQAAAASDDDAAAAALLDLRMSPAATQPPPPAAAAAAAAASPSIKSRSHSKRWYVPAAVAADMMAGKPSPCYLTVDVYSDGGLLKAGVACSVVATAGNRRLAGIGNQLPGGPWQAERFEKPAAAAAGGGGGGGADAKWRVHVALAQPRSQQKGGGRGSGASTARSVPSAAVPGLPVLGVEDVGEAAAAAAAAVKEAEGVVLSAQQQVWVQELVAAAAAAPGALQQQEKEEQQQEEVAADEQVLPPGAAAAAAAEVPEPAVAERMDTSSPSPAAAAAAAEEPSSLAPQAAEAAAAAEEPSSPAPPPAPAAAAAEEEEEEEAPSSPAAADPAEEQPSHPSRAAAQAPAAASQREPSPAAADAAEAAEAELASASAAEACAQSKPKPPAAAGAAAAAAAVAGERSSPPAATAALDEAYKPAPAAAAAAADAWQSEAPSSPTAVYCCGHYLSSAAAGAELQ